MPNGTPPKNVEIRLRVLEPTYDTLTAVAKRIHPNRRSNDGVRIGPLLDMVSAHLEAFLATLPPSVRSKFDRGRKLSEDQVRGIRASTDKLMCIAADHGISVGNVSRIRTGKAYRWVK